MTLVRAPDTVELLEALAQHLTNLGLARYAPNGIYVGEGLPAIFFGQLPDKPDTAILLNSYNDDRTRDAATPDYYVQLRFRAAGRDLRTVNRLADSVFRALDDRLHERSNTVWAGVNILSCIRHIAGPIAPDVNNRYTRPDSYTITTNPGAKP